MKKINLLILVFCGFSIYLGAQDKKAELGLKIGLQNHNIIPQDRLSIQGASQLIDISIGEIDYGFHAGFYGRLKALGMIIEPALLLNSQSVTYDVTETDANGIEVTTTKKEIYQDLDIPLLLGVKISFLKIHLGPVAHIHLNSTSELFDVSGYEQKFSEATFGYQGGIGADIRKLRLSLNYEGNFNKFADHLVFDGQPYSFSKAPSRLILSIGVAF